MAATVVLLVGTSSAGKSTLARALQATLPEHYLLLGLDDVFRMVSPRWGGGQGGPLSVAGFRYIHDPDRARVTIGYGDVGRAVLAGMHGAVAAFAQAGVNVIVDEMLLERELLIGWARSLAPYQTYLVNVSASLEALEARERGRRNPRGLAHGHEAVNRLPHADWRVDTTSLSPEDAARALAVWLQTGPRPLALPQYLLDAER